MTKVSTRYDRADQSIHAISSRSDRPLACSECESHRVHDRQSSGASHSRDFSKIVLRVGWIRIVSQNCTDICILAAKRRSTASKRGDTIGSSGGLSSRLFAFHLGMLSPRSIITTMVGSTSTSFCSPLLLPVRAILTSVSPRRSTCTFTLRPDRLLIVRLQIRHVQRWFHR